MKKVLAIREKLNIVNQGLLDPDKYKKYQRRKELTEIYDLFNQEIDYRRVVVDDIADALGQLRHD